MSIQFTTEFQICQQKSVNISMSFSKFFEVFLEADAGKRKEYLEKKYSEKLEELLETIDLKKLYPAAQDYFDGVSPRPPTLELFKLIFGQSIIEFIINKIDPTDGIYSEWIIRVLLKSLFNAVQLKRFFDEDWYKVKENLELFHQNKKLFKKLANETNDDSIAKLSDINQIKSFKHLDDSLQLLKSDVDEANEKKLLQSLEKDVEKIYNSENYLILIPKTREASCAYGRNTKWCTAAKELEHNRFKDYSERGPLYIIIDKLVNEKFQFHFQDKQYMDEKDIPLDLDDFFKVHSEIKEFLLKLAIENNDLYLAIRYKSEYAKEAIEKMPENKLVAQIKNSLLIALELKDSHPDLVNKSQNLFNIENEEDEGRVTLKTSYSDWSGLCDFVKGDIEGRKTVDILDKTNDDKLPDYFSITKNHLIEIRDFINADNLDIIGDYVKNNYEVDFQSPEELFSILDNNDDYTIQESIRQAYEDTLQSSYRNKLYEMAKDSVTELVPGVPFIEDGKIQFRYVRSSFLKSLVEDLDKMQMEHGEEEPTPSDWDNFYSIWVEKLKKDNDLVVVNYNDVEPEFKSKNFNIRLNEILTGKSSVKEEKNNSFSSYRVSNDMNQFDQYISKLWQEGLGTMGQGGLTNRGPAVTQTNSSTSTTVNRPATTTNQNNSQNHAELDVGAYFKNNSTDWDREMRMPEFQNAIAAHYDKVMLDPKTPSNEKNDLITKIQKTPALQKYFQDKMNKEMNPAQMQQGGMVR